MSGTNDFLPVATAGGANVELQAAYAADAVRNTFYADGAIPAAKVHAKMFRQSSVVTSQLMQMLADMGLNLLDDGNLGTLLATIKKGFRFRLQANTTFYVDPAGNDVTGDGSIGNPWATAAHALVALQMFYDLNGYVCTVFRNTGAYTDSVIINGPLVGQYGPSQLIFDGTGMAAVTTTSAIPNYQAYNGACFTVQNQKLVQTGAFTVVSGPGSIVNIQNLDFGAGVSIHINATGGGQVNQIGDYKISGSAQNHWSVDGGGSVNLNGHTITLTGVPTFGTGFALAQRCGVIQNIQTAVTFVGTATGTRYIAASNGVIDTAGKGATYLPGSGAGVVGSGGQYI